MSDKSKPKPKSIDPVVVFLAVIIVASLFATAIRMGTSSRGGAMLIHQPAPPIKAAGWINGPGPTPESLSGKVVVLDAWASWCLPCRAAAPEMVATYNRFRDQGVVFIGLTGEDRENLKSMEEFVRSGNIPWPNGYEATETLAALRVEFIPSVFVIDRQGEILWNSDEAGTLDAAIEQALAKPR